MEITKEFLINLVGKKIQFNDKIDNWEMYAEEGMLAVVTKFYFDSSNDDPVHKIFFDFSPYEHENHRRQNANYYDKKGIPCLTAVEAGYYLPQDDIYIDAYVEQLPFKVLN